jgi:tetratricopeptide (TPR) repeat protein
MPPASSAHSLETSDGHLPEGRTQWVRAVGLAFVLLLAVSCGGEDQTEPELAREALDRGLAEQRAGDVEAAGEAYREVLRHDPDNAFAFYNLGVLAQADNRFTEAEENYRAALNSDPTFVRALYNLATVRYRLGAKLETVDLYQQVIELDPQNASAHLNLAFSLRDLGKVEEAAEEFGTAVQLQPQLVSRVPEDVVLNLGGGNSQSKVDGE